MPCSPTQHLTQSGPSVLPWETDLGAAIIVHPPPHPIGCHRGNCQTLPRDILASLARNCRAQRSGPWVNLRQGEAEAGGWVPQVSTGSSSEVHPQSCGNQQPLAGGSSTLCLTSSPKHIHSFIIMFSFDLCLKCCFLPDLFFFSLQIFSVSMPCGDLCWLSVVSMARLFFHSGKELALVLPFLRFGLLVT